VVREVVRESGGGAVNYPTLTKTNYSEWAIIMRVQLQGAGLWDAVEHDDATERLALGAILRSVSSNMVPILTAKDNAKAAWDAIKIMRVGVDRVREARRQKLRKDFENLAFKSGESIEDFSLRISGIINELQSLGDTTYNELAAVQKFMRVVPAQYRQMACSIETLLDLKDMTIEKLSGRLSPSEGRGEPEVDAARRLLLTEEEWTARMTGREQGSGSSSSDKSRDKGKTKAFQGGSDRGNGGGDRGSDGGGGGRNNSSTPRRKVTAVTAASPDTGPRSAERRREMQRSVTSKGHKPTWRKPRWNSRRCCWRLAMSSPQFMVNKLRNKSPKCSFMRSVWCRWRQMITAGTWTPAPATI
jgi:hypothetical protein